MQLLRLSSVAFPCVLTHCESLPRSLFATFSSSYAICLLLLLLVIFLFPNLQVLCHLVFSTPVLPRSDNNSAALGVWAAVERLK